MDLLSRLKSFPFRRNAVWLIPLLLIVTYPLWSIPVASFLTPRGGFDDDLKQNKKPRNFNLSGIRITQNRDGRTSSIILARKARTGEEPETLLLEEINTDIYDRKGGITTVIANRGRYNRLTEVLTLIGNVTVHQEKDNKTLYSELLYYNNQQQTVECPGETRVTAVDAAVDGGNLFYDIERGIWIMGKPVHCVLIDH